MGHRMDRKAQCIVVLVAASLVFSVSIGWVFADGAPVQQPAQGIEDLSEKQMLLRAMVTEQFALPEEKQKYIWEIEHLNFMLTQDVVPVFRSALKEGRSEVLLRFLSSDFQGRLFTGNGTLIERGPIALHEWKLDRDPSDVLDKDAFVQRLVSYGQRFSNVEAIRIHVTALSPVMDGQLDDAWESQWDIHIVGRLANGGRAEHVLRCSLQFGRLTDSPASDVEWITGFGAQWSSYVSSPKGLMEEITDDTGIDVSVLLDNWKRPGPPYPPLTGGAHLLDYDRDGRQDVLINDKPRLILYRALGDGKFVDITEAAGLSLDSNHKVGGAVIADFDNDAFEDIVVKIHGPQQSATYVYRNQGDGTFRKLDRWQHNLHRYTFGYIGSGVADYDGDGRVDLYLAKEWAGAGHNDRAWAARWIGDQTSKEGVLLRNIGNWKFRDVTTTAGLTGEKIDTFAVVWLDQEPDGDADLFLANHMGTNIFWENQGDGTFVKRSLPREFGGFSMGATAGDVDGDGDPDLYLANMYSAAGSRVVRHLRPTDYPPGMFDYIQGFITGNELYENRGTDGLVALGVSAGVANSGWSYGPALVDLDGDGFLDIYSPAGFQSVTRGKPDG